MDFYLTNKFRQLYVDSAFICFRNPEPPIISIMYAQSGICGQFAWHYFGFILQHYQIFSFFVCHGITFLCLISSLLCIISSFLFYVHVCLQSVNCTLILWLLPILILLTFSVNESCVLRFQTFAVILVLIYYLLKIICNFFLGH